MKRKGTFFVILISCTLLFVSPTIMVASSHQLTKEEMKIRTDEILRYAMTRCVDQLRLQATNASTKEIKSKCRELINTYVRPLLMKCEHAKTNAAHTACLKKLKVKMQKCVGKSRNPKVVKGCVNKVKP